MIVSLGKDGIVKSYLGSGRNCSRVSWIRFGVLFTKYLSYHSLYRAFTADGPIGLCGRKFLIAIAVAEDGMKISELIDREIWYYVVPIIIARG